MAKLTLISSPTCPYVQRAIIALAEKDVPFEVIYVDLQAKPDWFLALSPLGKVPVLKVERPGQADAVVFESAVILEYLEETAGGRPMHPSDPLERAQHRSWIEFGSNVLADIGRMARATDEAEAATAKAAAAAKLRRLETVLGEGPFFAGEAFSFVDAVFGPAFRQLDALDAMAPLGLTDGLPKVTAWRETLRTRKSVRDAVPADFLDRFYDRLRRSGSHLMKVAA